MLRSKTGFAHIHPRLKHEIESNHALHLQAYANKPTAWPLFALMPHHTFLQASFYALAFFCFVSFLWSRHGH
jgi:hypothetical protein